MQLNRLGHTDIKVSLICLGSMTWGEQNSEQEAFAQLDAAIDGGINFIDTAEMYPVPPRAETYGRTESIIGNWIKQRGNRDKLVIATKVTGPGLGHLRNGQHHLDAATINDAVNDSLQRLGLDYIDLYQVHWPERKSNYFSKLGYEAHDPSQNGVPIEESYSALAELVKSGKVRHLGISNETPWGVYQYLRLAEQQSGPRIVSIQNPYNLLNRSFEVGLAEFACREQVGLLAYSPLGFGVLSGKYLDNAKPKGARLTMFKQFQRYLGEPSSTATAKYVQIAQQAGLDPARMALAFINTRPFVTSNIIGATTMEQLQSNISSTELKLPEDVLNAIQEVHREYSNPAP